VTPRRLILAVAVAVAVAVVAVLATSTSHGYEVRINLADADGLLSGSRVEIGGIGVGSVKSLEITPQDHAMVTISINKPDTPVGRNASVVIRPANLLGEKFLDLSVGNRNQPAPSGYTIPTDHTQAATDFDQIIDVLAPTERDRLAIIVHETGVALFGRGADVAKLLNALPPSLSDTKALISQVNASNAQLEGLITHTDAVVSTLVVHQKTLMRFVSTGSAALTATAEHADGLAQSVAEAPALLTQLDTTLRHLNVAGANLRPAARGLETTAPALTQTLTALPGFTTAALPALAEVKSISPQLVSLGKETSPVIARLKPTLQKLDSVAHASDLVTSSFDSSIDDLLGTMQNWARALQNTDGLSHEFRVSLAVPPSLLSELTASLGASTASTTKTPARTGGTVKSSSGATGTVANLGQAVSGPAAKAGPGVSGTIGTVEGGVTGAVNGVTSKLGLTHTSTTAQPTSSSSGSLSSLLGYLMGSGK
jgi:virulence factor Mce-like protein